MKRTILIMHTLLLLLSVCAQNKDIMDNTENLKKADSLVLVINDNLVRYDRQPFYTIQVNKQNCRVLIRINDLPFAWDFIEDEGETMHLPINDMIESSGEQQIVAEVYPLSTQQIINDQAWVNIKVFYAPDRQTPMNELIQIAELNLPNALGSQNLPSYNLAGSFTADVPFDSRKRLQKAKDLSKIPNIENKIKKKYEYINTLVEKGDAYTVINEKNDYYRCLWEHCYVTRDEIKSTPPSGSKLYNLQLLGREVAEIKDYEITFYHNNRIVVLRDRKTKSSLNKVYYWKTKERMDASEEKSSSQSFIALYMPEGSDELKVW